MASMEDLLATMSSGAKGDEIKALHAKLAATLQGAPEAAAPYRPIPLVKTGQPPPAPASSWNGEAERIERLEKAEQAARETRQQLPKHTDVLPSPTTFTQDEKAFQQARAATSPPRDAFQSDAFKSLWAQEKREKWGGFTR